MMIIMYLMIAICIILMFFLLIIKDIKNGKYRTTQDISIISEEAEEKYKDKFPEHSITNLKIEIEKVAEILINTDESNRYTEKLRQKAENDDRIKALKNATVEKVELIKFMGDSLKARIKYKDYNYEYSLILTMNTVATGRVFLNDYFVFKSNLRSIEIA